MELSLDKLERNKDLRAESLIAFINGLYQMDYVTIQHGFAGSTIPWSQLVRFNRFKFPLWNESSIDGFVELSGELLASIDKSFNSDMRKLLGIGRNRHLVFDLSYAQETLSVDTMAFLYNSGLVSWYINRNESNLDTVWLVSFKQPNTLCIFKESQDKYVLLDANNSEAVGIVEDDYTDIIEALCRHIIWHQEEMYELSCSQLKHLESYLHIISECLEGMYEISLVFGQLRLTKIGG